MMSRASATTFHVHQTIDQRASRMLTILLLTVSNIFMTFAWYGHLKYKAAPLWIAILASWGIAFFEYCFQVPANRIGHHDPSSITGNTGPFNAAQLKTIQEVITLVVFCAFSVAFLKEPIRWNHAVGFACMAAAVFFIFKKW
jgi:uncharacterized protein